MENKRDWLYTTLKFLRENDEYQIISLVLILAIFVISKSVIVTLFTILFLIGIPLLYFREILYYSSSDEEEVTIEEVDETDEFEAQEIIIPDDKIYFGDDDMGYPVSLDISHVGHMFVMGMTRYGKTVFLHHFITEILQKYPHDEVKLAFSDGKSISFIIYDDLAHTYAQVAGNKDETSALIDLVYETMNTRLSIFSKYSKEHNVICSNIDEYYAHTQRKLPRIVVIFDEIQDAIDSGSESEEKLITLAKMCLATGIQLVFSTQRPTAKGVSHEAQKQCQTRLCSFMQTNTEYGTIANIPRELYTNMKARKGLFMMFSPELAPSFIDVNSDYNGWGFVQVPYNDNETFEQIANKYRVENPQLEPLVIRLPKWEGSEENKFQILDKMLERFGEMSPEIMVEKLDINIKTARTWYEKWNSK